MLLYYFRPPMLYSCMFPCNIDANSHDKNILARFFMPTEPTDWLYVCTLPMQITRLWI